MNAICIGCPGALMGDCGCCGVTLDEERREDHDEEEVLDDWPDERDHNYEKEVRND